MQKRILLITIITILLPTFVFAGPRPVISLSVGADHTNVFSTKSITFIPPFQNTYIGTHHYDTEAVLGIFLGEEIECRQAWTWQLGVSYFQNNEFTAEGNVYQFSDPAFNNFTYQYNIQSKRLAIETKISRAFQQIWHPYVSAGIGAARNDAYGYTELPNTSDAVPMTQPFASHTTTSFIYLVGLGMDVDLQQHLRAGVSYRFVSLGQASLGSTPLQAAPNTLSHSHLNTNEFLVQISYIG